MKQVKTTKIKGNVDYAKVADRLLEFQSQNPRPEKSTKYSYDEGRDQHYAVLFCYPSVILYHIILNNSIIAEYHSFRAIVLIKCF